MNETSSFVLKIERPKRRGVRSRSYWTLTYSPVQRYLLPSRYNHLNQTIWLSCWRMALTAVHHVFQLPLTLMCSLAECSWGRRVKGESTGRTLVYLVMAGCEASV